MLICVLGNSHSAALKHGWDTKVLTGSEPELHFFSKKGQGLGNLQLDGDTLRLGGTENLQSFPEAAGQTVRISRYDAFILHGLGPRAVPRDMGAHFSNACRACAVADSIRGTAAWSLLNSIREVSKAPVLVGSTPLRAAERVMSRGPGEDMRRHTRTLTAEFGSLGARFVPQPDSTVVNGRETDPVFNHGVYGLKKGAAADGAEIGGGDRVHMNPAYGLLMMEAFLDALSAMKPARVSLRAGLTG